jgi:hypothetical protein
MPSWMTLESHMPRPISGQPRRKTARDGGDQGGGGVDA